MNRLVLTLLALLTGLVTQAAPAQSVLRSGSETGIEAVATARAARVAVAASTSHAGPQLRPAVPVSTDTLENVGFQPAAPVLIGVDRARE